MNLTRREKHLLVAAIILAIIFAFIPEHILDAWEIVILLVVVAPLGFYIATDPERMKVEK